MKRHTRLVRAVTALLLGLGSAALLSTGAASATICEDGWISPSVGSGTCSWHGGVDDWSPGYSSPSDDPLGDYYDDYLDDTYSGDSYDSDPYDTYSPDPYGSSYSDPYGYDSYSDDSIWGY